MSSHPLVNRTSPKGAAFIGTCASCGKSGITFANINEECLNPHKLSQEQALLEAVNGDDNTIVSQKID